MPRSFSDDLVVPSFQNVYSVLEVIHRGGFLDGAPFVHPAILGWLAAAIWPLHQITIIRSFGEILSGVLQ